MSTQLIGLTAFIGLSAFVVAAPIDPCSPPAGYDFALIRDPYYGYLGNVTVGTPTQSMTVFVDLTWTSQYFLSTTCSNGTEATGQCLSPAQQFFNQSASTSFVNKTSVYADQTWYPNEFFPAPFEVSYGVDVETIGPVSTPVTVQLSDVESGLLTKMPIEFGGIMGLMPSPPNTPVTQQSVFYQQYQANAWSAPYVAFSRCSTGDCPDGVDAVHTFGGYSTTLASKGLTWYPVASVPSVNELDFPLSPSIFSYWAIELSSFAIGDEVQALDHTTPGVVPAAIFDHASKGRGLPMSMVAYQRLTEIANATLISATSPLLEMPPNNGGGEFHQFDCAMASALPNITYTFAGSAKPWTVTSDNYVARVDGSCILDVRVVGNGTFQLGNFGDNFLDGKYLVLDYDLLRVGLADL